MKSNQPLNLLRAYIFNLTFYFDEDGDNALAFPASVAAMTSRGFEVWRAIRVNAPNLMMEVGEATKVAVTLRNRNGNASRKTVIALGVPEFLPFGVGLDLAGGAVKVDATSAEIAMEGVVWRDSQVISVKDTAPEVSQ